MIASVYQLFVTIRFDWGNNFSKTDITIYQLSYANAFVDTNKHVSVEANKLKRYHVMKV